MRLAPPVFLALLFFPAVAAASEYPLDSVAFLSPQEVQSLMRIPAQTTHEAGTALGKPARRERIGRRVGLKPSRLEDLAAIFDLMRVRGVGPRMGQLIHAAGVTGCPIFRSSDPVDLAKRLHEVNGRLGIAHKLPNAEILEHWIGQARALPRQFWSSPRRESRP